MSLLRTNIQPNSYSICKRFNKQMEVERYIENLWFNGIYFEHNFINEFTYVQQGIIMKLER